MIKLIDFNWGGTSFVVERNSHRNIILILRQFNINKI